MLKEKTRNNPWLTSPQTPSPRRFLLNKKPQNSTPTPSRLSHQVLQDAPDSNTPRPTSGPMPSQFARVPRFAMSTARRASFPPRSPPPAKPQFAAFDAPPVNQHEKVRDMISISDDDDDEMLDNYNSNNDFTPTAQHVSQDSLPEPQKGAHLTSNLPSSPKRRRVDAGDTMSTPQPTPGRFILPSTGTIRTTFTQGDGDTPNSNRPAFLMPSLPPPEAVAPLPDAFSPRRRGQKFVPGGLASELQSWIIETAQTATQSRPRNSLQVDDSVHVINVVEAEGDGPVFVHGTSSGKGPAKALLVDGQANQKAVRVKAGDSVSIKLPTWDVQVSGETWLVGVDWRTTKD